MASHLTQSRSSIMLFSLFACRWSEFRLHDVPGIKTIYWLVGAGSFISVSWPIGGSTLGFLLFQWHCVKHWMSQRVVLSSPHPWIPLALRFPCYPSWLIDELGNFHADRNKHMFEPQWKWGLAGCKVYLNPPVIFTDRSKSVLFLWFLPV